MKEGDSIINTNEVFSLFLGRKLVIATIHKKELVLAPLLEKELGVKCILSPSFNSDLFGTFSGEIERKESDLLTAKAKCELAMELANCDLALASEGSFGPHPNFHFLPADEELLYFIDKKNNLVITARDISLNTNFRNLEVKNWLELTEFAEKVKFPTHALILKNSKFNPKVVVKGIHNLELLSIEFNKLIEFNDSVIVETDMRAMYNPSRMAFISVVAKQLVEKIKTLCPECGSPGFSISGVKVGLPCEICQMPTRSVLSNLYHCQKCHFENEIKFPNGKENEDPQFCDYCNP